MRDRWNSKTVIVLLSLLMVSLIFFITVYYIDVWVWIKKFVFTPEGVALAFLATLLATAITLWDKIEKVFTKLKKWLNAKQARISPQTDKNPFFPSGLPLPADAPSYVRRKSDDELATALEPVTAPEINLPIAITGEFRIGKSSLLMRVMQAPFFTKGEWKNCYMDFQSMRTDDPHLFKNEFFKSISESLGKKITSWTDKNLTVQPIVLRLDEFGMLTPDVAEQLIPNLYSFMTENNKRVRIIVCLPKHEQMDNMNDFIQILNKPNLNNPKYLAWQNISVKPFKEKEIRQLLSLLPKPAAKVAGAQYDTILKLSSGNPLDLQCLCHKLFKAVHNKQKAKELIAIIDNPDSYKYP